MMKMKERVKWKTSQQALSFGYQHEILTILCNFSWFAERLFLIPPLIHDLGKEKKIQNKIEEETVKDILFSKNIF